ncbi:MAG: ATP-dependent Clp protease ATP-binding subunit ClpA [Bdellovibrionota bacterium]|nr:ATP-dependent Clp protease ATP-binding subunit ClpA [Bdellovibrionota bacterium]
MMNQKLEEIFSKAIKKANDLKHEYLNLEVLLLSLLDDLDVKETLIECGGNIDEVKSDLEEFLSNEENFSILTEMQIEELGSKQFNTKELREVAERRGIKYQPEVSLSIHRVFQRAAIHVQSSQKDTIKAINVLVSLFQEKESFALYSIQKQGITRFNVVKVIAHGGDGPVNDGHQEHKQEQEEVEKKEKGFLEKFTFNLNEMAKDNKIDPIIGRREEILRISQILCRRRKNNPILVGEAGVGKTAIAEGLAWSIVQKKVPKALENTVIYSLDMGSLLAGAKFRGDFEERLKGVIEGLKKRKDENFEDTILFIDEVHTVMGAGSTGGGSMDASNLLKPALNSGKLRCMGSTTFEEYRKFVEKDHAFTRRFQKVDIHEPSGEETLKILQGLKGRFEAHHGVKYSNTVLKTAVDLSEKFIADRKLPDKAIDVIDEAGAAIQLLDKKRKRVNITINDVENTVSSLARVPKKSVAGDDKDKLRRLNSNIKLLIYGQDKAIDNITDSILLSRSGLGSNERPMGSFLFSGPTGVGKTELCKQLALSLGIHFECFDMSEYMEKHSVAKLIGAPPGYVGYDRGGLLTDAVHKNPHCVLLLDEIEKAHPDLFNILLQVMDRGVLTDAQGRSTDFRNVILVMTTNAGAKDMEAGTIGLGDGKKLDISPKRDKAIKNFFSPEFRNRLDKIIHFNKLSFDYIIKIVDKFLLEVEAKLIEKGIDFVVEDNVKSWLANEGYNPKMGARPIGRLIDEKIKRPLSKEVLFGALEKGGNVKIILNEENEIGFIFGNN